MTNLSRRLPQHLERIGAPHSPHGLSEPAKLLEFGHRNPYIGDVDLHTTRILVAVAEHADLVGHLSVPEKA